MIEYEYQATRTTVEHIRGAVDVPRPAGNGWILVDSCSDGTHVVWTWRRDANPPSPPVALEEERLRLIIEVAAIRLSAYEANLLQTFYSGWTNDELRSHLHGLRESDEND